MNLDILQQVAGVVGCVSTLVTAAVLLIKPIRDKVLGFGDIFSGMKCLLRADMLRVYYKHHDRNEIRQHERENSIRNTALTKPSAATPLWIPFIRKSRNGRSYRETFQQNLRRA